jgi:hypothetical protein
MVQQRWQSGGRSGGTCHFAAGAAALPPLLCPAAATALQLGPPLCRRCSATAALPYESVNLTLSNMEWMIVCEFVTLVQMIESGSIYKKQKSYKTLAAATFEYLHTCHKFTHYQSFHI